MSSYIRHTQHPENKEWQDAAWIDDHFGNHNYGVKFLDGKIFDPRKTKLQTAPKIPTHNWEEFYPEKKKLKPEEPMNTKPNKKEIRYYQVKLTIPDSVKLSIPWSVNHVAYVIKATDSSEAITKAKEFTSFVVKDVKLIDVIREND